MNYDGMKEASVSPRTEQRRTVKVQKEQCKTFLQSQTLIFPHLLRKKKSPLWWYFERNDALGTLRNIYTHAHHVESVICGTNINRLCLYSSACPSDCCDCRIISQVPSKGYCWAKVSHGTAWHPNPRWSLRKVAAIPLGRVVYQWHCTMWTGAGSRRGCRWGWKCSYCWNQLSLSEHAANNAKGMRLDSMINRKYSLIL